MGKKVGASLEQAMPKPSKDESDFQSEDDMRTMHQASSIAADPARLKKVHKLAGRKHKALQGMIEPLMQKKPPKIRSLDDLKKKAYAKDNKLDDDGDDDMGA
jgi:hypothetical protein